MTTTTRPLVAGPRHAVSAGHYLASAAGLAVLEAGGNAIDAGVAAGLALGVVQPDIVNIGGVAPILVRRADGRIESIAGLGHWPRATPPDALHGAPRRADADAACCGRWSRRRRTPGSPRSNATAPWASPKSPARRSASPKRASRSTRMFAESVAAHAADYAEWPSSAAIFLPGGAPPPVGAPFRQPDLARTLRFMADEERARGVEGRSPRRPRRRARRLLPGDIARTIVRFVQAEGGWLSAADMAGFRSRIEPVVTRAWRGHAVTTCGPWCQGPALLEALLLMERAGFAGMAHNSAPYLHLLAECLKAAMADREYHFGDPAFTDVPLDALLGEAHLAARLAGIDGARAHPGMPPPLLPSRGAAGAPPRAPGPSRRWSPTPPTSPSWTPKATRSRATPSDGSYHVPIVPGLGLIASSRGTQSRPDPAHPSGVWPGKRPRLTPNPALVVTRDGGVMPFGSPGGDVQIQAMLQVLLNHLHFGMDLQEAVEAPRVATYAFPSSFAPYDYFPRRLAVEGRVPEGTRAALRSLGHEVEDWPDWTWLAGSVEAVRSDPATGMRMAGADPRRPAYALAM